MDDSFSSLRIDGGMFSPEFLQRVADANPEIEGCSPADFSTKEEVINNLRDHLNYVWKMSISHWERWGPTEDQTLPASRVKGFIQRLMRDLGLDLNQFSRHISSGERPQLAYNLGGSLWHAVSSEIQLDERSEVIGARRTSPHNLLQGELTSSECHGWGLLTNGHSVRILRKTNRPSVQESLEFDLEKMFTERLYSDFCLFAMIVHGSRWSFDKENPMDCWLERWYKSSKEEGLSVLEDLRKCVQQAANAFGTGIIRFSAGNQELRDRLRNDAGLKDELQREIMRYMYKLIFLFVMEDRDLLLRKSGEQNFDSDVELGRKRYALGYSTQRHRNVITSIKGDEHNNSFEEVKIVFKSLYKGESRLALPALGSYLFSDESTPMIDNSTIPNSDFLKTLFHLCTFKKKDGPRQRVHWKTLRETELGSVYESLLELRPDIDLDNGSFTLISEAGNDRKSSGSYYTPSELVDHLVTTTIDPLLKEAKKAARKSTETPEEYQSAAIESILKLTVCDPACGSGHFLVAALERIAMELARIETGEHHPGLTFIRKWKRLASSRCIYGVDLNPLAVELCKVAIWMDTYDGTNPLSFLDGHIRHGNSLLGQRLEKMGLIPDDAIPKAWTNQRKSHRKYNREQIKEATKGVELQLKKIQKEYGERKRRSNQQGLSAFVEIPEDKISDEELKEQMEKLKKTLEEIDTQKLLPSDVIWQTVDLPSVIEDIASQQAELTLMSESTLEEVQEKSNQLQSLVNDGRSGWAKEVLDASMAMWWWPDPDVDEFGQMMADPPIPLASMELNRYATWLAYEYEIEDDVLANPANTNHNFAGEDVRFRLIRAHTERIAGEQSFFHWELEFAEVFFNGECGEYMGGFSAMIGNPPWDVLSNEEKDWFTGKNEQISLCNQSGSRKLMIKSLETSEDYSERMLFKDWMRYVRKETSTRTFLSKSGSYPCSAVGKLNLAPLITELVSIHARSFGIVIPSNTLTDISTRGIFGKFFEKGRITEVIDIVNKEQVFRGISQNTRFMLLSAGDSSENKSFNCLGSCISVPLDDSEMYVVSPSSLKLLFGDEVFSCPLFKSKNAYDFMIEIAKNNALLNDRNGWNVSYGQMINMSTDNHMFQKIEDFVMSDKFETHDNFIWDAIESNERYFPLYEAKLFDAFSPRFGDFSNVDRDRKYGTKAQPIRTTPLELSNPNYSPAPRYWIPAEESTKWFVSRGFPDSKYQIATRGICRGLVESRTLKSAVLPTNIGLGHSAAFWLMEKDRIEDPWILSAIQNSLQVDFQARMKLTGMNLSKYIQEQLFLPRPEKLKDTYVQIDGANQDSAWKQLLAISKALHYDWVHLAHPLNQVPNWLNNEPNPLAALDVIVAKVMGVDEEKFRWLLDQFPIWERQLGEQTFRNDRISWFKRIEIIRSRQDAEKINVERLLSGNENLHVEYKQTLQESRETGTKLETKNSFIKAVIGMANHQGGYVIVGVKEEDGNAVPVGFDTKYVNDNDKAQKSATQMIEEKSPYAATLIDPKVHLFNELKILVIKIKPSIHPIYCDLGDGEKFYLRLANTMASKLEGEQLEFYLKDRFDI